MAPKASTTSNGKASGKPATPVNGTTTEKTDTSAPTTSGGRPDKKAYDAEQDSLKAEIEALQVKLSAVREKISLATKGGAGNERRTALRAELDEIRGQQSNNKSSRSKVIEDLKRINESVQTKIKALQAAKAKVPFKNVAEVDAHIKNLESRVESGNMKLAEEKRALQEISQCKRNRRQVESFQADQEAIEAERASADALRAKLDDPQFKATSDRFDAIKAELDQIKVAEDEAYAGRSKLFSERDLLQDQLNALWSKKRESSQQYREANDRFYTKLNEDRARRAERARAQRAEEEAAKKKEIAERILEEAQAPAFQGQIEDCQTLIDYFSGKTTGTVTFKSAPNPEKADIAGVEKLDLRKVDASANEGLVARKKKGEEEESYFVGGKGKKGKKGPKASPAPGTPEQITPSTSTSSLNVPLATLTALLSLSIPPPTSSNDVPRLIEDLKTKKAWFEANQSRVTAENISKAEAEVKRLTNDKTQTTVSGTATPVSGADLTGPNGGGEKPAEPAPTPKATDTLSVGVPFDDVDKKLETVEEVEQQS